MLQPIIHLASIAGSTRKLLEQLRCGGTGELIERVQAAVGDAYRVEGDAALIEAAEDDRRGGRVDDAQRAAAISRAFRDEHVAALVALRGGAWLTRILDRIDFAALERRARPIAIFGFSELTTLLNIAAAYPRALCVHGLGPAFLRAGLRRFAELHPDQLSHEEAEARFPSEFLAFFDELRGILEGRGTTRVIRGQLVAGELANATPARIIGGNLAVLVTLLGTPFQQAIEPAGRWLLMEDINESPERIDRRLAQLKLAGMPERCAGLIVGDFHEGNEDRQDAVLELLRFHVPAARTLPVVATRDLGHVWPMSPLPLNAPLALRREIGEAGEPCIRFDIEWPRMV